MAKQLGKAKDKITLAHNATLSAMKDKLVNSGLDTSVYDCFA